MRIQPTHLIYDKEPQRVAYNKLEIFNIQLPLFAEREPDFSNDGECWLYVMYQAHIKKMTPREVLKMNSKLERFANTNPGFEQFETRFRQAIADPELLDLLRMEASERIRQAGMRKAAKKEGAREIAQNMLSDGEPMEKIMRYTGLTREEIKKLHNTK